MRILFITRTHPHRQGGAVEARLHDRLRELSELGHEVLVLTKWSGEAVDFDLPSRIEIRSPFKSFRPWEWPGVLPMVFAWRPELLHIFDPGLSALERAISIEMVALTMMETLRRTSRGRSNFYGTLVSVTGESTNRGENFAALENIWKRAGAEVIERGWMRASGNETASPPWDHAPQRPLRIVMAGRIGHERPLEHVLDALNIMRTANDFNLTVLLDRASLSAADRRRLAHAERGEAHGVAVGSRLHLVGPLKAMTGETHDLAIIAGLPVETARAWLEQLPMPAILSEMQKELAVELANRNMKAQILGRLVTEIAPIAQSLAQALDRNALSHAWSEIEHGGLSGGRDVAANHVSRIYSQIAGTGSASYS